jgi:hypothetical protein
MLLVTAAVVIQDVSCVYSGVGLLACCCWLHNFCWRLYCGGGSFVAFTPAVACIPAVVDGHAIAVILSIASCWRRAIAVILAIASCWRHCCCLRQLVNCELSTDAGWKGGECVGVAVNLWMYGGGGAIVHAADQVQIRHTLSSHDSLWMRYSCTVRTV